MKTTFSLFLLATFAVCRSKQVLGTGLSSPQRSERVFAVINGAWGFEPWSSPERTSYLTSQLHRYVAACEAGWEVHVGLVTYKNWNYTGLWQDLDYYCHRRGEVLPVKVYMFPLKMLPNGTFGTMGTLAYEHRKIFLEKRAMYDMFICQEDDVVVNLGHLMYFHKWTREFHGTKFYPGFYDTELFKRKSGSKEEGGISTSRTEIAMDWRWKKGQVFNEKEHVLFSSDLGVSGRIYFLSSAMLEHFSMQTSWLGAIDTFQGEFNPYFGSAWWLSETLQVVIPLEDLLQAQVHHIPNRYIRMGLQEYSLNPLPAHQSLFVPLYMSQLRLLYSVCLPRAKHLEVKEQRSGINFSGQESSHLVPNPCRACLEQQGRLDIDIVKENYFSSSIRVEYVCNKENVKIYRKILHWKFAVS